MPDQLTDRARKAAEEIHRILMNAIAKTTQEWSEEHEETETLEIFVPDSNVDVISAIIERHCRECVEDKKKNIERIRRFNESEFLRFMENHKEATPCLEK